MRRLILAAAIAATGCSDSENKGGSPSGAADTHANKAAATEAKQFVKKMAEGARAYYLEMQIPPGSVNPAPPQFPVSAETTPPLGSCCEGDDKRCQPRASDWDTPTWTALQMSLSDPHHYSYQFTRARDGKSFTARAFGDLDCDGTYSTFQMIGTASGDDEVTLGELSKTDELE